MIETFVWPAALAFLSALAFIAYKHPQGYDRMFSPLLSVSFGALLTMGGYSVGLTTMMSRLWKYIDDGKITEAQKAIDQGDLFFIVFFCVIGFQIYIVILRFLPEILGFQRDAAGG